MRRIRVEQKGKRNREDRSPVLSLDPTDPDVVRAKRLARGDRLKERA